MAKKKDTEAAAGSEPVVPAPKADDKSQAKPDMAHMSLTDLLMEGGGEMKESVAAEMLREEAPGLRTRGHVNLLMLLVVLGAMGGGGWYLAQLSSHEVRQAKIQERLEKERAHREEQIAKMKKYGNLRIETEPPGAMVVKDGEKIMIKDEATGEEIPGLTPVDVRNMDVSGVYKFEVVKEGYETFTFSVAEHVWTRNPGDDDFTMTRQITLVPNACEYWFLFDSSLKKEMRFPDQDACNTHRGEAVKKNASVTECTCKQGDPAAAGAQPAVATDKK